MRRSVQRGSGSPKRRARPKCPEPACVATGDHSPRLLFPPEREAVLQALAEKAPDIHKAIASLDLWTSAYCSDVWCPGARRALGTRKGIGFTPYERQLLDVVPRPLPTVDPPTSRGGRRGGRR